MDSTALTTTSLHHCDAHRQGATSIPPVMGMPAPARISLNTFRHDQISKSRPPTTTKARRTQICMWDPTSPPGPSRKEHDDICKEWRSEMGGPIEERSPASPLDGPGPPDLLAEVAHSAALGQTGRLTNPRYADRGGQLHVAGVWLQISR
jgi:hypothetical protein